jgi:hypothetical protein
MQTLAQCAGRVAVSLARAVETRRVLARLHEAGVSVLLIKGAHVEWTCYDQPHERERSDIDMLVRDTDRTAAATVLAAAGYTPALQPGGKIAVAQRTWFYTDAAGVDHALDLHWRLSNVQLFRRALEWDELWAARARIIQLGAHAFGPSVEHALLLACIHRIAHHARSPRWIWLDDIHRLSEMLDDQGWRVFSRLARDRGLGAAVAASLEDASAACGSRLPASIMQDLNSPGATAPAVARFIARPGTRLGAALSDWRQLGARDRLTFIRDHVFPPPSYIRDRYNVTSRAAIAWMYLHRLFHASRSTSGRARPHVARPHVRTSARRTSHIA